MSQSGISLTTASERARRIQLAATHLRVALSHLEKGNPDFAAVRAESAARILRGIPEGER